MTASAGAWYRVGTVNVTKNNQIVTGVTTNWQNDVIAIAVGDIFTLDAKTWYEVTAVASDTSITLDRGFEGATGAGKAYAIVRNTSGTILTRIAGQVSVQFNQKQLFLDELRTWLNSTNASEELTDSHGLKRSLKTPAQMVADHDNRLAELDEIHPFPWAMRKVEFEARRAANNEKFAASGFVYMGKQLGTAAVNEGMTAYSSGWSEPNDNRFWLGRTGGAGTSKEDYPVINVDGVLTNLHSLAEDFNGTSRSTTVLLPIAEEGTRTYDSSTGVSVTHATPAIAFASETETNKVVTDRTDMWGFEAFVREISDADPFVYLNGLIQSRAGDINGVYTAFDNIRPVTYFAWYEGNESSKGRGVNWQTASEANRIKIASDPANNIYFDDATGKFYQWSIRGRSFAGPGNGDWDELGHKVPYLKATRLKTLVPQGNLDFNPPYTSGAVLMVNSLPHQDSVIVDKKSLGTYGCRRLYWEGVSYPDGVTKNSDYYFLACGTVKRLNQGAYHPSLNPTGSGRFVRVGSELAGGNLWSDKEQIVVPETPSDCFIKEAHGGARSNKDFGRLYNSYSGRPDARFYDVIYLGGDGGICRDMRYSAWGLTSRDFSENDLKVKVGSFRGAERLPVMRTFLDNISPIGTSSVLKFKREDFLGYADYKDHGLDTDPVVGYLINNTGEVYDIDTAYQVSSLSEIWIKLKGADTAPSGAPWSGVFGQILSSTSTVADVDQYTEVIGNPGKIALCPDLAGGWVGGWNPQLPSNQRKTTSWGRRYLAVGSVSISDDLGVSWSPGTPSIWFGNSLTNATSEFGIPEDRLVVAHYPVSASQTKLASNSDVFGGKDGVGSVWASYSTRSVDGSNLAYSLAGVINKVSNSGLHSQESNLTQLGLLPSRGFSTSSALAPQHPPLALGSVPQSSGVKALRYNVETNQQGFINYAYTELKHNGVDWGDDARIPVTSNQAYRLDDNGNSVVFGTSQTVEPLGWVKNDK